MSSLDATTSEGRVESWARAVDVAAKVLLVLMLVSALADPDYSNLRDKAPLARAVGYPLLAFTLPLIWFLWFRDKMRFPWLADLCITIPCFSDILGNRWNFYDTIWWFDDWIHFQNGFMLVMAVLMLTMSRTARPAALYERALALGATGAIVWEIAEYYAFLHRWDTLPDLYEDTLGDLVTGTVGALLAATVLCVRWSRYRGPRELAAR